MIKNEVNAMEDMENREEVREEGYQPRPAWQVWGARVVLVIFIIGLILYYCNLFGAVK